MVTAAIAALWVCGGFLTGYGAWRAYGTARHSLLPLVHDPDRERAGAGRRPGTMSAGPAPGGERSDSAAWEVARTFGRIALAVAWLLLAMLGLFMLTVASQATR